VVQLAGAEELRSRRHLKVLQDGHGLTDGGSVDEERGHGLHGVQTLVLGLVLLAPALGRKINRPVLVIDALEGERDADTIRA
jgi:hypothetical protein